MIVLDASVLVKLFVKEPLSELAHELVAGTALILGPELVRLEVASALTRKVRNREIDVALARRGLRDWREFAGLGNVRLTPDVEVLESAERLSLELGHPLADCLYLAVAQAARVALVTADQPFVDAVVGRFPSVRHLASFGN